MKPNRLSSLEHSTKQQGMNQILKLIMWMSVFLLIFTVENVYSQDTLNCADSDSCTVDWSYSNYLGNMGSGITGHIYYRYRICNGINQMYIDSAIALDNGRFLDSINRYHYQYNAFSDLADIYLLQHHYNNNDFMEWEETGQVTTPVVQLYKASCGVWLKCSYYVWRKAVECDTGYDPPLPIDSTLFGADSLHIYKWQPCGTVCCQKTYQLRRWEVIDPAPVNPPIKRMIVEIRSLSISRAKKTPQCTKQDDYDIPCQDGC
ncbi:MAG: hypothetical protein JNL36_10420 [Candidatus Kapabacteria bacterium]|jgi:hypothetical protein|nr:hypothetical protein [Candidatus Kapabacteria bacterium]